MPDYLTRILCFNEGNSDSSSLSAAKVVPDPRTMKSFVRSKLIFFSLEMKNAFIAKMPLHRL